MLKICFFFLGVNVDHEHIEIEADKTVGDLKTAIAATADLAPGRIQLFYLLPPILQGPGIEKLETLENPREFSGGEPMRELWLRLDQVFKIPLSVESIHLLAWLVPVPDRKPGPIAVAIPREFQATLGKFYSAPFVDIAATEFLNYIRTRQAETRSETLNLYAKTISIVQSSGTGKSRTMTEHNQIGRQVITLPMCLRGIYSPGWPLGDDAVYTYLENTDQRSATTSVNHFYIAALFGSAYQVMLDDLVKFMHDGKDVLKSWYTQMEGKGSRESRSAFYDKVISRANAVINSIHSNLKHAVWPKSWSATSDASQVTTFAKLHYQTFMQEPYEDLMKWLSDSLNYNDICLTYIDEAHNLGQVLWVAQRLVSFQTDVNGLGMWHVYMSTKSSIDYFAPQANQLSSFRSRKELSRMLPVYYALGFDHNIIAKDSVPSPVTMGYLSSVRHLALYGRPLWGAMLSDPDTLPQDIMDLAELKLVNADPLGLDITQNKDVILAVLSQRLCIDPILMGTEAMGLTDRSISNHLRSFCGASEDRQFYYPDSPSEPMLALAASRILYREGRATLKEVLSGFEQHLCSAGLVEIGLLGEFAARLLLLTARDHATPPGQDKVKHNLLQPVPVVDMLKNLFESDVSVDNLDTLLADLAGYYVNFTHWSVTKGALPEKLDKDVLANLWARTTALQFRSNQAALDCLIVMYKGPIDPGSYFDVDNLTPWIFQVKLKREGDYNAGAQLRPMGFPQGSYTLPYLAMLMELGMEQKFKETNSKVQVLLPSTGSYEQLSVALTDAQGKYDRECLRLSEDLKHNESQPPKKFKKSKAELPTTLAQLSDEVNLAQSNLYRYNRHEIKARGCTPSTYGILTTADIASPFQKIIVHADPQPLTSGKGSQTMSPLGYLPQNLGSKQHFWAWMKEYSMMGEEPMDTD